MLTSPHFTLGFENELEATYVDGFSNETFRSQAAQIAARNGLESAGTYKYDSTIDFGFEFCSTPFESDVFLSNRPKRYENFNLFKKWFEVMKSQITGLEARDNTGMHIHIGRDGISAVEILKMNYFVFRNQKFCEMIGERKAGTYCYPAENPPAYCKININRSYYWRLRYNLLSYYNGHSGTASSMKYKMINVARPVTVEFRFFKATTDYNVFLKNMQFVIALASFVRHSPISIIKYRLGGENMINAVGEKMENCGTREVQKAFCDYVYKNRAQYKQLYMFLMERGFCLKPKEIKIIKRKAKTSQLIKKPVSEARKARKVRRTTLVMA